MIRVPPQLLSLEDFLALPEGDIIYELVDGRAIPKTKSPEMSPKRFHSRLQPAIWLLIERWCTAANCPLPGLAYTEWAIALQRHGVDWVPVPGVSFLSTDRLSATLIADEACPVAPELAVEIISLGQTFGEMAEKATDYIAAGVLRVWIVDPVARTMTVFAPNMLPVTHRGDRLYRDPLFSGLEFTVEQIFQEAKLI